MIFATGLFGGEIIQNRRKNLSKVPDTMVSSDFEGLFKNGAPVYACLKRDMQKIMVNNTPIKEHTAEEVLKKSLDWLRTCSQHTCLRINTQRTDAQTVGQHVKEYLQEKIGRSPVLSFPTKMSDVILIHSWEKSIELDLNYYDTEIIVDDICGGFVLKGAPVYGPGIIGIPSGLNVGDKVSVFADINGACLKGTYKYEDENKVFLGNGILKKTRHSLFGTNLNVNGIGVEMTDLVSRLPPMNMTDILQGQEGICLLQHLPCVICTYVLDPKPGEFILDMCAAPGSKTTHISNYTKGKATIVALDIRKDRARTLIERCKNFSAENVKVFCCDARKVCAATDSLVEDGPPFNCDTFDKVLLDAPCSGLGQRPLLLSKISVAVLESFKASQQMLFKSAVRLLKPNGILVYSTCTITISENEEIVAWALRTFPCLRLQSVKNRFQIKGYGESGYSVAGLTEEQAKCVCRFGPETDSIGFFIACFEKTPKENE